MKPCIAAAIAVLTLLSACLTTGAEAPSPDRSVLIVYDTRGGMRPRERSEPRLLVYADGEARVGNPSGRSVAQSVQWEHSYLDDLIRFIVEEMRFFELDRVVIEVEVDAERRRTGKLGLYADAAESLIRIRHAGREHEVRYYALSTTARLFPDIATLGRLHAVEERLKREIAWIRVGGVARARRLLGLANAELAARRPDLAPLTLEAFVSAEVYADGSRRAVFARRQPRSDATPSVAVDVFVFHDAGGPVRIEVVTSR